MTKPEDKIPKWLLKQEGIDTRGFKEWKRGELRKLALALNRFGYASAYIPEDSFLDYLTIVRLLSDMKKQLSQKEWGR